MVSAQRHNLSSKYTENRIQEDLLNQELSRQTIRSIIHITDNIKNPKRYSNSKDILNEFNKHFPDTKVDFGYLLPKGGVALHLKSKEERDKLISLFTSKGNAFGGGITPHHLKEDKYSSRKLIPQLTLNS